ncbi:hypothetical protein QQ045_028990 [Rhodiola kirilowii]
MGNQKGLKGFHVLRRVITWTHSNVFVLVHFSILLQNVGAAQKATEGGLHEKLTMKVAVLLL